MDLLGCSWCQVGTHSYHLQRPRRTNWCLHRTAHTAPWHLAWYQADASVARAPCAWVRRLGHGGTETLLFLAVWCCMGGEHTCVVCETEMHMGNGFCDKSTHSMMRITVYPSETHTISTRVTHTSSTRETHTTSTRVTHISSTRVTHAPHNHAQLTQRRRLQMRGSDCRKPRAVR